MLLVWSRMTSPSSGSVRSYQGNLSALRLFQEPVPLGPDRSLCAVADPEPLEGAAQMSLDRLLTDPETPGDLLVGQPSGHQSQDLSLSSGQGRPLGLISKQGQGGAQRERRCPVNHGSNPVHELLRARVPRQTADAGASIRSLSFGVASRITFTCGPAETIPRINAARSRSGMERSIKVTSGGSRRIEVVAASASRRSATRDLSG